MPRMNRRHFLYLGSAALVVGTDLLSSRVRAAPLPTTFKRKLVNITLEGGPDLRHLFVPPPDTTAGSYGASYWRYRAPAHYINPDDPATWISRYGNDYLRVTQIAGTPVPEFGVLKRCKFLYDEIVAGRVAIVSNVEFSQNRDHANSLLMLEAGDLGTHAFATDRDGWGGRLASYVSGNVFSMTRQRLLFCNIPSGAAGAEIVSARDTRNFGLAMSSPTDWQEGSGPVSDRALTSYYAALRASGKVPDTSPYRTFTRHEEVLRGFTANVRALLADHPVPADIAALYSGSNPVLTKNRNFGEQVRNVYDCFACESVTDTFGKPFNFRVGSLEYGGWDSHNNQRDQIEPSLEEIFGDQRGLHLLRSNLANDMPSALDSYVVTVAGEFGRQLRANGARGTDHGRGNYFILMGNAVRGGVYGEMFPMEEITTLVDNQNKYERFNCDIDSKTALSRVLGAVADWVADDNAAGDTIFVGRSSGMLETGVTIDRASLFTT